MAVRLAIHNKCSARLIISKFLAALLSLHEQDQPNGGSTLLEFVKTFSGEEKVSVEISFALIGPHQFKIIHSPPILPGNIFIL